MKLFEILQDNIVTRTLSKSTKITPSSNFGARMQNQGHVVRKITNKLQDKSGQVLGSGVDAIVFQSKRPQDAGVVTKWIRNQKTDAKTNPSIQFLAQGQHINSTYIPRVYNVTQYKRPNGIYEYSIQMEKLPFDLQNYLLRIYDDQMLMRQLLNQVFTEPYADEYMDQFFGSKKAMTTRLGRTISHEIENGPTENTSPNLKNTLQHLKNVTGVGTFDVVDNNMMIRLTPQGPQLVITDPFTVV